MTKKLMDIIKEDVPSELQQYKKPYDKMMKSASDDTEMVQAKLRGSDDDLESAASKFGMGSGLDFYPLVSMEKPFNTAFEVKFVGAKIPVHWKGEKSEIEGDSEVDSFNAVIWLDPESFKKVKGGSTDDEYKFKIVKIDNKELNDNYLIFRGNEINITDKRVGKVTPQLSTSKKYNINISVGDDEVTGGDGGDTEGGDVDVPEEIANGRNRNEIFRLLLNRFGDFNGYVVHGDGFKNIEDARAYGRLLKAIKAGKEDESKAKEFRDKVNRDSYAMMISNLRKSFPSNFLSKLSKAFPEFNITFNKESIGENIVKQNLLEEENSDKYKRWNIVFPGKVVGGKSIDALDKNIINFMKAVKKWFAVPIDYRGKKQSYTINYDEDKVNKYFSTYYSKKESMLSIGNILNEIVKDRLHEDDENIGTGTEKKQKIEPKIQLIFNKIEVKGMKRGEQNYSDDDFDRTAKSLSGGGKVELKISNFEFKDSLDKIKEKAEKSSKNFSSGEVESFIDVLKNMNNNTVGLKSDRENLMLNIGKTKLNKNIWLNIPIKDNGGDLNVLLKKLGNGDTFIKCSIAYADPYDPFIKDDIVIKLKLK